MTFKFVNNDGTDSFEETAGTVEEVLYNALMRLGWGAIPQAQDSELLEPVEDLSSES